MPFFDVVNGTTNGDQSLWNQFADALSAKNDTPISTFAQIAAPGAPSVAINTTAGNLSGAYQYAVAFVTGCWEGPAGTGTFHQQATTEGGTASAIVSPSNEQVDLSNIPIGGTGVYQRILYRTKAGGTSFFYLDTLSDNTTTTYTDNALDSALGAGMPTTNTTGSDVTVGRDFVVTRQFKSVGDTTEVANLNAQYLQGYTPDSAATADTVALRDPNGNLAQANATGATNKNILFNPSWDLGFTGWTQVGTGWAVQFGAQGSYVSCSSAAALPSNTWWGVISTKIPVAPNVTYTFSLIIDPSSLAGGYVYATVRVYDSNGNQLQEFDTARLYPGNSEKLIAETVTMPANADHVIVEPLYGPGSYGTARWWNLKFEFGSVYTTYSDDSTLNTIGNGSVLPLMQIISGGNQSQSGSTGNYVFGSIGNQVLISQIDFPVPFSKTPNVMVGLLGSDGTTRLSNIRSTNVTSSSFGIAGYVDAVTPSGASGATFWWLALSSK